MQTRLPRRVLRFGVLGVSASRKSGPHALDCAHPASLPDYRQPINPAGVTLARKDATRLDDMAGGTAFLESEQSKN
jgi:hypothetical protein